MLVAAGVRVVGEEVEGVVVAIVEAAAEGASVARAAGGARRVRLQREDAVVVAVVGVDPGTDIEDLLTVVLVVDSLSRSDGQ